jgi:hypothetical protein
MVSPARAASELRSIRGLSPAAGRPAGRLAGNRRAQPDSGAQAAAARGMVPPSGRGAEAGVTACGSRAKLLPQAYALGRRMWALAGRPEPHYGGNAVRVDSAAGGAPCGRTLARPESGRTALTAPWPEPPPFPVDHVGPRTQGRVRGLSGQASVPNRVAVGSRLNPVRSSNPAMRSQGWASVVGVAWDAVHSPAGRVHRVHQWGALFCRILQLRCSDRATRPPRLQLPTPAPRASADPMARDSE